MTSKRRTFTKEFKLEAASLVLEQSYSIPEAARSLGGRSARGLLQFCELISDLKQRIHATPPSELIQHVIEKSGYVSVKKKGDPS